MRRGLVIGKFMPLHTGHIALINFAMARCDELIVFMNYTAADVIDPALRFSWIKETFHDQPAIKPEMCLIDFDDELTGKSEHTKHVLNFTKNKFTRVEVVFSSDEDGTLLARNLGLPHISFDPSREQVPVSGTLIRQKPFRYWDYIPTVVRPYFVKRICFYGPESTGKSFMAHQLAGIFKTEYVPEVARELITSNNFSVDDIIRIGRAQTQRVIEKTTKANKLLFCDTDLITTQLYSKIYLNIIPPILYELEKQIKYDMYFLFDVDVPWIADGLRDLGTKRKEVYDLFKNELAIRKIPYVTVQGLWKERSETIIQNVKKYF